MKVPRWLGPRGGSPFSVTDVSIRQLATAAAWTGDEVRVAANVAAHAERALREVGDARGAAAARETREGLRRPAVTLVVAGEFQQGKSSLVNALLGARVTPTEPLGTTAVPIRFVWGDLAWHAHLAPGDDHPSVSRHEISAEEFDLLATSDRSTIDGRLVLGLDATLDHPLLGAGVELIDTPCISGGLSTPAASVVLSLLVEAAGLVFVTDASQELTGPEVEFLRMARTLCPTLLVVLSKIDLYPEWRRLLDIDQNHLAFDADALVLPASPRLRAASVRWGDSELDRESGLPLLSWYLGTTMMAKARQAAVSRCAATLSEHLTATGRVVEDRLAVLDGSSGRRGIEERYLRASEQIERLRSAAPKRVRLELRSFARVTTTDLTNRFSAVNDELADFIKTVDPAEDWPEIEATLHRAVNLALAEHIAHVRSRAEEIVVGLGQAVGLDDARLSVELDDPVAIPALAVDLDVAHSTAGGTGKVGRVHDVLRGALATGFMGAGLAATILTGGLGALALGAGASASTVVLTLRRDRTRDLDARRANALQACRKSVAEARAVATGYVDELTKELEFQLESQIEKGLRGLLAETEAERDRLAKLRRVAAENVPEEIQRVRAQLDRLRLVEAHARRLDHRLARPELQVVAR